MHIHNLSTKNSILNTFISEIRDKNIQKDTMRFRRNIERIGETLGYEMSKALNYKSASITTPLGINNTHLIENLACPTLFSLNYILPIHLRE